MTYLVNILQPNKSYKGVEVVVFMQLNHKTVVLADKSFW